MPIALTDDDDAHEPLTRVFRASDDDEDEDLKGEDYKPHRRWTRDEVGHTIPYQYHTIPTHSLHRIHCCGR